MFLSTDCLLMKSSDDRAGGWNLPSCYFFPNFCEWSGLCFSCFSSVKLPPLPPYSLQWSTNPLGKLSCTVWARICHVAPENVLWIFPICNRKKKKKWRRTKFKPMSSSGFSEKKKEQQVNACHLTWRPFCKHLLICSNNNIIPTP